jgi:hypothetical protein
MNTFSSTLAALTLLAAALPAQAQSLRCKQDFTQIGDSKAGVLAKCGEPATKDAFCKPVDRAVPLPAGSAVVQVTPCETVDEWTYNPGYGQFLTTLRFESGKLVAVRYGDRVK